MTPARFVELYSPCALDLARYARGLCRGTAQDAEDLVQEALLKAWQSRHGFTEGSSFRAWLFVILRNQFRDEWRKRNARDIERRATIDNIAGTASCPQLDVIELREILHVARRLPASHQIIIRLASWGYTYAEMARRIGIPEGTVRSRLSRARDALRTRMEQRATGRPHSAEPLVGGYHHQRGIGHSRMSH